MNREIIVADFAIVPMLFPQEFSDCYDCTRGFKCLVAPELQPLIEDLKITLGMSEVTISEETDGSLESFLEQKQNILDQLCTAFPAEINAYRSVNCSDLKKPP